ncbi:hypothetical protein HDU99_000617 [Rhizoclosmatium hyalinum]|nr:hypothetical protein HDU99_000617 [Rhizoclosmatium hyalinum]
MTKIFCVLSTDPNLTPFEVIVDDPDASVSSFKDAIYAKRKSRLEGLDAADLTLVRVFKGDVGGLTTDELEASKEVFHSKEFLHGPEHAKDDVSIFRSALGMYQVVNGTMFKVMDSAEQLSFYTSFLPRKLCHVLVLVLNSIPARSKDDVLADLKELKGTVEKYAEKTISLQQSVEKYLEKAVSVPYSSMSMTILNQDDFTVTGRNVLVPPFGGEDACPE